MSFWPRELPKTHKPEEMGIDQDHAISYSFPFPYISISHDFPRLPQKFPIDIDGPIASHSYPWWWHRPPSASTWRICPIGGDFHGETMGT